MNDTSGFDQTRWASAGLWQRASGVPMPGAGGRPHVRFRAVLSGPEGPKKRPIGRLWRRGPKALDVPVHHPVDKWDRMIWVRPDTLSLPLDAKVARRRRTSLAGRHLRTDSANAAGPTSSQPTGEAPRSGSGWTRHGAEAAPPPSSWHRKPVKPNG